MEDSIETPTSDRPHTLNVLVLLAGVAVIFSYLGAYAVTNALVKADLIQKWPPGSDPRPRWMLIAFVAMLVSFVVIGGFLRWSTNRQLRGMDSMEEAT
jgi:NhaP-type Na+/H+ or K+/H+ antiporter